MAFVHRLAILLALMATLLAGCATDSGSPTATEGNTTQPPVATEATALPTEAPNESEPVATEVAEPVATEVPEPTKAAPTEVPAPTEAPQAETPSLAPAEAVRAAMRAQLTGGPYRAESTITSDGTTSTLVGEVIPPDQIHGVVEVDGTTNEIIVTGGQLWINQGDGWSEPMSGEMVSATLQGYLTDPDGNGIAITNEQFAGVDAIDGKPTWIYTYTQTIEGFGEPEPSEVRLWVEIATGLPLRLESSGNVFGSPTTVVQVITYDPTITIAPPQ